MFIDEINRLHTELRDKVLDLRNGKQGEVLTLVLTPKVPNSIEETVEEFRRYLRLS